MDENLKTNRNRGELWQYDGAELVDLDRDGDLDLVLGQIRDTHPYHLNQHSIMLENEGTGDFGRRYLASLRIGVRRDLPNSQDSASSSLFLLREPHLRASSIRRLSVPQSDVNPTLNRRIEIPA